MQPSANGMMIETLNLNPKILTSDLSLKDPQKTPILSGDTSRRYFQESLRDFHPKAQVWKAKILKDARNPQS